MANGLMRPMVRGKRVFGIGYIGLHSNTAQANYTWSGLAGWDCKPRVPGVQGDRGPLSKRDDPLHRPTPQNTASL